MIPEVVARIQAAVNLIRKEGVPAEEFEKAKAKLITARAMRNTTASERAFQASLDELYGLGFDYEESHARRINAIRVEDLQAVDEGSAAPHEHHAGAGVGGGDVPEPSFGVVVEKWKCVASAHHRQRWLTGPQ